MAELKELIRIKRGTLQKHCEKAENESEKALNVSEK
jgi:hypothetical protein